VRVTTVRKLLRLACCGLAAVLMSAGGSGIAHADPAFTPPPDIGDHSWCYGDSFSNHDPFENSMATVESETIVDTVYQSTCKNTTDVVWLLDHGVLASNVFGQTTCDHYRPDIMRCDQWNVQLNTDLISASKYPTQQKRQTVCHELGHTLGVSHYPAPGSAISPPTYPSGDSGYSCMRSGEVTSISTNWFKTYGTHHITKHINPWFGQ